MPSAIPLPVAEWMPDLPAFNFNGQQISATTVATNVVPRTPLSYGPMPSLGTAVTNALTKTCQGAYACLDLSGNAYMFAGDANDLYQVASPGTTFSKVSKSAGAYSCPNSGEWHMALFGARVIATDFADNVQSFLLGRDSAFSDLSANCPKAKYVAVIKSWVVLAYITDTAYSLGTQPQWVWWCSNNDPTTWPQPGTSTAVADQSSYQPLYGEGGLITGIVGGLANADGAVFMQHAVYRVIYNGTATTFDFLPAGNLKGCQSPNSIVQVGSTVYYWAEDGIQSFDGAVAEPIGANKVDKFIYADLDQNNKNRVVGTLDPTNKLIFWAYPGAGNSGGVPNRVLVYNYAINRFAWITGVTVEWLVRALTFGYTLDQLYTVLGYTIDGLPYPLSSPVWQGGLVALAGFNTSHALGFFSGSNLAATLDTPEVQPGEIIAPNTDNRCLVTNARPWIDGGTPSVNIGSRNRLVDSAVFAGAVALNSDGLCPQSVENRYIRGEITTLSGDSWTHISGMQIFATATSPI